MAFGQPSTLETSATEYSSPTSYTSPIDRGSPTEWEAIRATIEGFNFLQVQAVMQALDWKWGNKTPTVEMVRTAAERLLTDLFEDPMALSLESGRLRAERSFLGEGTWEMKLSFEACSFCAAFSRA
jgi:hypothetical protein